MNDELVSRIETRFNALLATLWTAVPGIDPRGTNYLIDQALKRGVIDHPTQDELRALLIIRDSVHYSRQITAAEADDFVARCNAIGAF